jgi:predicted Zn-dependent peptidase
MTLRFDPPRPGASMTVRFPPIARGVLPNGMQVWSVARDGADVVTMMMVIGRGTSDDPPGREGLASLTGDLLDEGAGDRDAIALSEALARLGSQLEIDVGPDVTTVTLTALARRFLPSLGLLADVVVRPRLEAADFARVRELRLNRLRQISQAPGTVADRMYVTALFGAHPYGHGALGTTASLEQVSLDEARTFWAGMFAPSAATLIVGGSFSLDQILSASDEAFRTWLPAEPPPPAAVAPSGVADPRILLVNRPGAPQVELRIGHVGPPRSTPDYHAIVTLNALLGGQFTSRINRSLREEQGITYGARTSFGFRRVAGTFACETSVQADRAALAVGEILKEFAAIREDEAVLPSELGRAKASLTRGYVRHFETEGQLVRAAAQLATYALDDETFDRFVPLVGAVTASDVQQAAVAHVRPEDSTIVAVGDAESCLAPLETLGRRIVPAVPDF